MFYRERNNPVNCMRCTGHIGSRFFQTVALVVAVAAGVFTAPPLTAADNRHDETRQVDADQLWHLRQSGLLPRYRTLPRGYHRIEQNGYTWYHVRGYYYRQEGDEYVLFTPPPGGVRSVENLDAYADMPTLQITAPAELSSSEIVNDKAQCHYVALDQTGFDPTLDGGGVKKSDYALKKKHYRRGMVECLQARGYEAR